MAGAVNSSLSGFRPLTKKETKMQTKLRIIRGNTPRLQNELGHLASKLEIKAGDTQLLCDTEEQVAVGRAVFETLIATGGYTAVKVDEVTKESQRVSEFDPEAGLIVLFGPVAGG